MVFVLCSRLAFYLSEGQTVATFLPLLVFSIAFWLLYLTVLKHEARWY